MKDKKFSTRYKINIVGFVFIFLLFFAVMAWYFRIFDKFYTATIIRSVDISTNNNSHIYEITFLVDGEEFTTTRKRPLRSYKSGYHIEVGDKIQYLAKDPNITYVDRPFWITVISVTEGVIVAVIIAMTVCEIKGKDY